MIDWQVQIAMGESDTSENHLLFEKEYLMKILVIDDSSWNQDSARQTLKGHDLTVIGTVEEAFDTLHRNRDSVPFDAVLTDLWMPAPKAVSVSNDGKWGRYFKYNSSCLLKDGRPLNDQIPAGLVFALWAARRGIKTVICTDSDHHRDRLVLLMDLIDLDEGETGHMAKVEARYFCVEDRYFDTESGEICPGKWECDTSHRPIKDWSKVLKSLLPEFVTSLS